MFGGVCFMINGNMCCGVVRDELMLRLGKELATEALDERHTRPMDFTGKPMKSMIFVETEGFSDEQGLKFWVDKAAAFAASLPPKKVKA
jgi:TfoX/Sxy family transcriptional regulator of competence genes